MSLHIGRNIKAYRTKKEWDYTTNQKRDDAKLHSTDSLPFHTLVLISQPYLSFHNFVVFSQGQYLQSSHISILIKMGSDLAFLNFSIKTIL